MRNILIGLDSLPEKAWGRSSRMMGPQCLLTSPTRDLDIIFAGSASTPAGHVKALA